MSHKTDLLIRNKIHNIGLIAKVKVNFSDEKRGLDLTFTFAKETV